MYEKPSDLLVDLDSHGIYHAEILEECSFDTSSVPTFTPEETVKRIEERGVGGTTAEGDTLVIYGWTTAEALAKHFLGHDPAAIFEGRGRKYRACYQALTAAGH